MVGLKDLKFRCEDTKNTAIYGEQHKKVWWGVLASNTRDFLLYVKMGSEIRSFQDFDAFLADTNYFAPNCANLIDGELKFGLNYTTGSGIQDQQCLNVSRSILERKIEDFKECLRKIEF